jgi:hypothetical protein
MDDFKKKPDENERQYIWRIGQMVDSGRIDNWSSVAPILNQELRVDESDYRTESAYRKPYQYAKGYYEDVFSRMVNDDYAKQLEQEKDELFKIKRQVLDQRREYNKLLISDARSDHLTDCLIEAANKLNDEHPLDFDRVISPLSDSENDAVLVFSDWHYGMTTDNIWNTYNTEICKNRVKQLVYKAKKYILQNKVQTLYVVLLGDAVHGSIHTGCRVASEEDTCDEFMHVSEIIAEALSELSTVVDYVKVYSTYGNHARTIQNKNDSVYSDNMEKIVPWWLRQRLQYNQNIEILDSEYKEFIKMNVRGHNVVCVHGDLDRFKDLGSTVNTLFTKKFGETIDYTISGDKHHLEEFEQFGIESILVRSLCGSDEYANNHRLYSSAGQSLLIFNEEDGRVCTYNIKLN